MAPLAVALLAVAAGGARASSSGLFLVGGAGGEGDPASLVFASGEAPETVIAAEGGAWKLRREGAAQVALDEQLAALPATESSGEVNANSLSVGGVAQWHLWDLDTFDVAGSAPWSANDRSYCAAPEDHFLGGHCKLAGGATGRQYTDLPAHTHVKVTARAHYFDEWNGEDISLALDSNVVWAQAYNWCPGFLTWKCLKFGVDSCGRDTPDRLSVHLEATVPHTASSLGVVFASNLPATADPCKVSWGVDDVAVELLTFSKPKAAVGPVDTPGGSEEFSSGSLAPAAAGAWAPSPAVEALAGLV